MLAPTANWWGIDLAGGYAGGISSYGASLDLLLRTYVAAPRSTLRVADGGVVNISDVLHLEPRATVPATPSEGDVYYDAGLKQLSFYNGAVWTAL
jgi:hypothetical protein